jgi:SAM-dependent MidA family methyltransferase
LETKTNGTPLVLLEAGAHRGQLASDILGFYQKNHPRLLEKLEYWIVDPSPVRRRWQTELLKPFEPQVRWFEEWPSKSFSGVVFSNELLDAMPVRRLGWDAAQKAWFEFGVGFENGRFVWTRLPGAVAAPCDLPGSLLSILPDGFATEISPAAEHWWSRAARSLESGWLVACDYGLDALDFFTPERREGTLRSYFQHRMVTDVLYQPGRQDITAQVNFTRLRESGEWVGLRTSFDASQEQFLVEILQDIESGALAFETWTPQRIRELKTLTHPQHFGRSFRVLAQKR